MGLTSTQGERLGLCAWFLIPFNVLGMWGGGFHYANYNTNFVFLKRIVFFLLLWKKFCHHLSVLKGLLMILSAMIKLDYWFELCLQRFVLGKEWLKIEIVSWSRFLCICICLFVDEFGQGGLSKKGMITLFAHAQKSQQDQLLAKPCMCLCGDLVLNV